MVSDGGGRFIPAGIVGLHTLSLLLASLVAHDRATEDNQTQQEGIQERPQTNTNGRLLLIVGAVHKPSQGGINSVTL